MLRFNQKIIAICLVSLFSITNAFADASSTAGAGAAANAGAIASGGGGGGGGTGVGIGGGGLGIGGSSSSTAGLSQTNALNAGSTGNYTGITFGGTIFPADTTSTINNRTTIDGTQTIKNVAPVMIPGLASANGTCRDSHSAGFSIAGLALGGGTTSKDADCNRRYEAATMASLGRIMTAFEIMCAEPANRAAALRAGDPCAIDKGKVYVIPTQDEKKNALSASNTNIKTSDGDMVKAPLHSSNSPFPSQWWQ